MELARCITNLDKINKYIMKMHFWINSPSGACADTLDAAG